MSVKGLDVKLNISAKMPSVAVQKPLFVGGFVEGLINPVVGLLFLDDKRFGAYL